MNKCAHCSRRAIPKRSYCHLCSLRNTSTRVFGVASRRRELYDLYVRQGGRCFYTGEPIQIGKSASIEHVIPQCKTKGQFSHIDNLKWVHQEVNRMKSDMSFSQFIKRCIQVLTHFGYTVSK